MAIVDNSKHMKGLERDHETMVKALHMHHISEADIGDSEVYQNYCKQERRKVPVQELPERVLKASLYNLGMDIEKKIEVQGVQRGVTHRRWNGQIYRGRRYCGTMRSDPYWTNMIFRKTGVKL